jgi:hypothetical protein
MAMYRVTIRECKVNGWSKTTRVRAESEWDARARAVKKLFGRNAGWWADSGLGPNYGQVTEPMRGQPRARNCITDRVATDITEG